TFPQAKLSIHSLPAELSHAPTVLIWRKGARSPKISAFLEVLTAARRTREKSSGRRLSNRLIISAHFQMWLQHAVDRMKPFSHARLGNRALDHDHNLRLVG